jgi:hypothetical protein
MPVVDSVEVLASLRDEFFAHLKDQNRAREVWAALQAFEPRLRRDAFLGDQVPKKRFPRPFRSHQNLWRLALPHGHRVLYTVLGRTTGHVKVRVEWIGDHKAYDKLFGYSTS